MDRCAKIVCTIGPASQDEATIARLMQAGMDVARLNFSHGTHEEHARTISRLRAAASHANRPICILQDLQGPKIRTGDLASGKVELVADQLLTLTTRPVPGDNRLIPVDFTELPQAVQPGGRILLDDGNLELVVISVEGDRVETRVIQGGTLKSNKGINLPGMNLDIPSFTAKDKEDLEFGLEQCVDAVAMSFVKTADDVRRVRLAMNELDPERKHTPIIAKLERPEALDNLEEIMQATDGVMVARGDLGVEMPPEAVPIAQKQIIECANRHGKMVITATQMLESMIHSPRPTRAEASDVANAVFDGTDAVMLSGETASGEFPVQSVQMMDHIVREAEEHMEAWGQWKGGTPPESTQDDSYFLTLAAKELAHDRNVAAIATFTTSGRTALLMSKRRPNVPIFGFTPDVSTYRRMGLYWGVKPHLVPQVGTIKAMLVEVESAMLAANPIAPGQQVVLICGFPVDQVRPTNLALLHTVGS